MTTGVVALDESQYVMINTCCTGLTLQAHNDAVRIAISPARPAVENLAFHVLHGSDAPLQFQTVDTAVWALAMSPHSQLTVTETPGASDYFVEVAAGNVDDAAFLTGSGELHLTAVDTVETLWSGGGVYQYPSPTGETMEVVSSDAVDTGQVSIMYLDADWNTQLITLTMTGTAPVAMPEPVARIQSVSYLGPATLAGDLTVQPTGGGSVYGYASREHNNSRSSVISIPAGFDGQLMSVSVGINDDGGNVANVVFRSEVIVEITPGVRSNVFTGGLIYGMQKTGASAQSVDTFRGVALNPKTDISFTATSDSLFTSVDMTIILLLKKQTTANGQIAALLGG